LFLLADLVRRRKLTAELRQGSELAAAAPGKTVPGLLFLMGAVAVAGLPPFSGFLAKTALLLAVPSALTGLVWALILCSSLLVIMGLVRTGIRLFWHVPGTEDLPPEPALPTPPRPFETGAAALLLAYILIMSVFAGPLLNQTEKIAGQLLAPQHYLHDVSHTLPRTRPP